MISIHIGWHGASFGMSISHFGKLLTFPSFAARLLSVMFEKFFTHSGYQPLFRKMIHKRFLPWSELWIYFTDTCLFINKVNAFSGSPICLFLLLPEPLVSVVVTWVSLSKKHPANWISTVLAVAEDRRPVPGVTGTNRWACGLGRMQREHLCFFGGVTVVSSALGLCLLASSSDSSVSSAEPVASGEGLTQDS